MESPSLGSLQAEPGWASVWDGFAVPPASLKRVRQGDTWGPSRLGFSRWCSSRGLKLFSHSAVLLHFCKPTQARVQGSVSALIITCTPILSSQQPDIMLSGCFQKIRAVYESNPAKFKTLQNILEVEKEMYGSAWPKTGATLALMWLKR